MKPRVVDFKCKVTRYSLGMRPICASFDVTLSDGKHDRFIRTGTEQIEKTREALMELMRKR